MKYPNLEFPGVIKKRSSGISRGLGLDVIYLIFLRGLTQFGGVSSAEALLYLDFPGIKVKT